MTGFTSNCIRIIIALVTSFVLAVEVHAQAVERHVPQIGSNPGQVTLSEPDVETGVQDSQPFGPALRAIRLLGPNEAVATSAQDGVSIGTVERLQDMEMEAVIRSALTPFLGRPLSFKLIDDIKTAIAEGFREANYPFVSVSTPEQEISDGSLQVRVIEFMFGQTAVSGNVSPRTADSILSRVDIEPGSPINTRSLSEQLDWINRYPFRQLQSVFSPGTAFGTTDLSLQASESKPWTVYAGYNNDGTRATGHDRFYFGGAVGGLLMSDSVTAFQLTGSGDALLWHPDFGYASAAVTYRAPVGPGEIEAVFNSVRTHTSNGVFLTRTDVTEASLGYRLPLTGWPSDGAANVRFGIEANRQSRQLLFGDTPVYEVGMDVWQLYLGLQQSSETWGDLDLAVHFSPGGLTSQNTDAQAALYTLGRMDDASYVYLTFDYGKQTDLGFGQWVAGLSGQYSPDALPSTAQSSLGGMSFVRGYSSDAGSFDTAVVFRNELRFDSHSFSAGETAPYLFADAGWGRDTSAKTSDNAASVGAGLRA